MRRTVPVAAIGLVFCFVGLVIDTDGLLRAWLVVALFALGFPLGAMMVLMMANLTGGKWAEAIHPILLAMAGTLPLALVLFLPLLIHPASLLPWLADPAHLSETASRKLAFLNLPGLELRFLAYALLWLALAIALGIWRGGEPRFAGKPMLSGLGLALHALVFTAFTTDWMLALEPDFYSTIYPMLVASEQIVAALAAAVLLVPAHRRPGGAPEATLGEDLSKLLLAAVFVWAYLAFMQWIVIWSGNLPPEIGWYLTRMNGGWQVLLWAALTLGLVIPFAGLIGRRGKRDPRWERAIIVAALVGQVLEAIWRIAPAFPATFSLLWMIPAAMLMGGAGHMAYEFLRRRPLPSEGGAHGAIR
jgi:hypothetical protein